MSGKDSDWKEMFEKFGWNKDGWVFVNAKGRESVKFFISDLLAQTLTDQRAELIRKVEALPVNLVDVKFKGDDKPLIEQCVSLHEVLASLREKETIEK